MTEQEAERLDRLITLAQNLTAEVAEVAKDSGVQLVSLAQAAKRNRLMIWALALGGALLTVMSIALTFAVVGVMGNTDRIDRITTRLDADNTEQRRRALCPLYGIFLDSKSPEGRAAAPDKAKYDHSFEVIEEGYRVLGCSAFLEESGKDKW